MLEMQCIMHSASLQTTHPQRHCSKLTHPIKSSTTHSFHAETAKEDSVAQGAAALLRAQSLFRAVSRQPSALAGLVAALMAGSQYNSPKAQQAILDCYLMFALRFIRPPQLALAQVSFAYDCLLACLVACWLARSLACPLACLLDRLFACLRVCLIDWPTHWLSGGWTSG